MNPKHNQQNYLSQLDADFLCQLTDLAEKIEPDQTFKAHLEAELLQTHPSNSHQKAHKGYNHKNSVFLLFIFNRLIFNRRASLVACAFVAIAAVFAVPIITSGRTSRWLAALVNPTVDLKANAQTIAQLMETGQITVTADAQQYDETTQEVRAIGNAAFVYPEAQIQGNADEIRYVPTARQVTLLGNVQISQKGENLQGTRATCSLEQKRCTLTQN
ncbi:LptA/OstA family protein [Fischerella sp. JS2]|uniref:LptA/OstA family protein n=1 Tax=Fischerella sp. JS2 TaxID=2597771 RepID=UPI0028E68D11|nr:LptA/OstA family protein [Fischerella sp. JS2]